MSTFGSRNTFLYNFLDMLNRPWSTTLNGQETVCLWQHSDISFNSLPMFGIYLIKLVEPHSFTVPKPSSHGCTVACSQATSRSAGSFGDASVYSSTLSTCPTLLVRVDT